jgi:hypothetical protein
MINEITKQTSQDMRKAENNKPTKYREDAYPGDLWICNVTRSETKRFLCVITEHKGKYGIKND